MFYFGKVVFGQMQDGSLFSNEPAVLGTQAHPRWRRDHCTIQPKLIRLHCKPNGVLWPWDVLSNMWDSPGHEEFFRWVHDPMDEAQLRCAEYWERCSNLDFFKKLQDEKFVTDPWKTIPISWHTDGVKVYKTQKVWSYSFSSAVRKGTSLSTKTLFLLFRDCDMQKPYTHDAVAKLVGYVMRVLGSGVFPEKDHEGNAWPQGSKESGRAGSYFAGGWTGAFACFKADLEGRVLAHKLVRNWASDSICEHCLASKLPGGFCYGDFSDKAAYWECMFTHDQFMMLNPIGKNSAWVDVPGWDITRNLDEARNIETTSTCGILFWFQFCCFK